MLRVLTLRCRAARCALVFYSMKSPIDDFNLPVVQINVRQNQRYGLIARCRGVKWMRDERKHSSFFIIGIPTREIVERRLLGRIWSVERGLGTRAWLLWNYPNSAFRKTRVYTSYRIAGILPFIEKSCLKINDGDLCRQNVLATALG